MKISNTKVKTKQLDARLISKMYILKNLLVYSTLKSKYTTYFLYLLKNNKKI